MKKFLLLFSMYLFTFNISALRAQTFDKNKLIEAYKQQTGSANTAGRMAINLDNIAQCGSVEAHELRLQRGQGETIEQFEEWISRNTELQQQMRLNGPRGGVQYIPYVVHICHTGEDVNTVGNVKGINISVAQVESQINALNNAFRKINFERDGSPLWDDVAADMELQFVPAVINPDTGDVLPEPGIDRVNLVDKNLPTNWGSSTSVVANNCDTKIKPATIWDPNKVFNIWIYEFTEDSGLLGYAQFPDSNGTLPGLPNSNDAGTDGVVMDVHTFQDRLDNDGSFTPFFNSYSRGGTTIHEVGHWVGLRHIWGDGDCNADDYVEDTPNSGGPTSGCFSEENRPNTCGEGEDGDLPDMFENYMDYSNDDCLNLFTEGQKGRKDVVFSLSPRRLSLLTSEAGDYPDTKPFVLFDVNQITTSKTEGLGCVSYTEYDLDVKLLNAPTTGTVIAKVSVDPSSTASEGTDFRLLTNTVTFTGDTTEIQSVKVRVMNDGIADDGEKAVFNLELVQANGAVLYDDTKYLRSTWTFSDGEADLSNKPKIQFVNEGGAKLNEDVYENADCSDSEGSLYNVALNIDSCVLGENDVTVTVSVNSASTAREGQDFTFPSGKSITFNGENTQTITIPVQFLIDGTVEGKETLILDFAINGSLATKGDVAMNTLTILDSDLPAFNVSTTKAKVIESDNVCTDVNSTYTFDVIAGGCVNADVEAVVNLVLSGTAVEGEDYTILPKSLNFSRGSDDTQTVTVEIINDLIIEGDETLNVQLTLEDDTNASIGSDGAIMIAVSDPIAHTKPEDIVSTGIFYDFDNQSFPATWSYYTNVDNPVNNFVVGENSPLKTGKAFYVSNDIDEKPYETGTIQERRETTIIVSPEFTLEEDMNTSFDFIAAADIFAGIVTDIALYGLVDAEEDIDFTNINDYRDVAINAIDFNFLLSRSPDKREFNMKTLAPTYVGKKVRFFLYWQEDKYFSVDPLAIDNFSIENIKNPTNIEVDITPSASSFPVKGNTPTYFYSVEDGDIEATITSESDHGCTTVAINNAGKSSMEMFNTNVTSKTFITTTENASTNNVTVGLYYTEDEIAGWEAATGLLRSELKVFKYDGDAENVSDCLNYSILEFTDATFEEYENGYKVSATFTNGLQEINTFGLAVEPNRSPGAFTAVQSGEQVDIEFTNRFNEENIAYYIVNKQYPESGTSQELKTFPATGSSTYKVTDFFPRNGLNIYSVTYIMKNGEQSEVCYTANVYFEASGKFKISPNPAVDQITVALSRADFDVVTGIEIYDELGQTHYTEQLNQSMSNVYRQTIDVSTLSAGVYFVRVQGKNNSKVIASFVKQ